MSTTAPAGQARIGRTIEESAESWPSRPTPPAGAPNVVVIVLDDVGFAHYGCFGSSIATPSIDRLADEGLRYANFHTTAVCSPTRAALLTGRNPHAVGFGHVTERIAGYPGYSMRLPDSAATIAEVLRGAGYSTRAVGKWHLTPSYETGPQGPYERWPLGRGFERYYGFLGGSTDQFAPELCRDNSPTSPPASAEEGYHLSADLVDEAIDQLSGLRAIGPDKPFFLYLAFGAGHAPHQAPPDWIERYRGVFDDGWDAERRRVLARQIELGVMPEGTQLGLPNPGVEPWESLSEDEQRLYARMMEVYAALISYTDAQIGRLLDFLDTAGIAEDTVVLLLSDNGASGEGGPEGSVDEGIYLNGGAQLAEVAMRHIDDLGGPKLYNHYPWGWAQAGNTPFRWYKQFTHAGGITNGLLVRYPREVPAGEIRHQYHHVIDVAPTLLDLIGIPVPETVRGVTQQPMHGVSMRYSFGAADAESTRHTQHYEMWGNRGLWHDGWMAVCRLHPDAAGAFPPAPMTVPFDELPWELYDHRSDPTECVDLAQVEPRRLRAMVDQWWALAGKYDVLPVDTRPRPKRWPVNPPRPAGSDPEKTVFLGPGGPYERGASPQVAGRSFAVTADVVVGPEPVAGVLYTVGGHHGGYCWYADPSGLHLEAAVSSVQTATASARIALEPGPHRLGLHVVVDDALAARVRFMVDGSEVGGADLETVMRRVPIGGGRSHVGRAPAGTVSRAFTPPYPFNGVLERLTVTARVDDQGRPLDEELAGDMREQ